MVSAISFVSLLSLVASLSPKISAEWAVNKAALRKCSQDMNGKLPHTIPSDFHFSGRIRRYYITAEQVHWNYIPSGWDNWLGVPVNQSTRAYIANYVPPALGYEWEKALYRGYTDASFRNQTEQPPTQGTLGPIMRAEVGDMLEILFLNTLSHNYASMHSMGLAYNKKNEGSEYPSSFHGSPQHLAPPLETAVAPGECVVLKWLINQGSAPTQGAASHFNSYHSYVAMDQDINAGLIGPTIIYARGKMAETMATHREFPLLYMQFAESVSFLSGHNKMQLTGSKPTPPPEPTQSGNHSIWYPQYVNLAGSQQLTLAEAPIFDTLNGYIYANNHPFEVCVNDPTIWYVMAYGTKSHTFHMHGNGIVFQGMNLASIGFTPGEMKVLYASMNAVGPWQLICHVAGHQTGGMVDNYIVYPTKSCPLPKLSG